MFRLRIRYVNSEKGIALVAAIIASLILLAIGMLVIALSTGDIRTSSRLVGDKRAINAAEKGIHRITQNFDPLNLAASAGSTTADDVTADANSQYTIGTPVPPTTGPATVSMSGFSIGGGQSWGMTRYDVNVTGKNTAYNTQVTIGVGVGYGPIEVSTMSR